MKNKITIIGIAVMITLQFSCKKYLDVVPDNVATIDYAFTLRTSAEKYLFNCYSYMPAHGHFNTNPGITGGDEVWYMDPPKDVDPRFWNIARGQQNVTNPLGDFWLGEELGKPLWMGIRDCNIFLDNIHKVPDMDDYEKDRWRAEVLFLKAYYHFYLMRMYGPVPIMRTNLPIASTPEEVRIARAPVDSVVNYIVELLDEAFSSQNLSDRIVGSTEVAELGRVTKTIVLALKAKVLVTAASPLFNGNNNFPNYKNPGETAGQLFPAADPAKWTRAATACKEAIDFCQANGHMLYHFPAASSYILNDTLRRQFDLRGAVTDKFSNPEIIWANTSSRADINIQRWSMPILNTNATSGSGPKGILAPPIKMAEQFYTSNGVPITEDKTWDYPQRFSLRKATAADKFYIKEGEETVQLHFNREPRFYASLGFDRGIWFGNWINNSDATKAVLFVKGRKGEYSAKQGHTNFSQTGYWIKKLVNVNTSAAADGALTYENYPWPEIRMADLYLMYAEALNEANGPGSEAYQYINLVRERASLKTVEESWTNFATDPTKYTTKAGLREIIQQERLIELAFEGQRFWDLRRWMKAHIVLNAGVRGWNITQTDPAAYYKEVLLYSQSFKIRDYFWPIQNSEILKNRNMLQSPGW
jgi:starch-binding outer membrane protein, SusD/RagB family